MTSICSYFHDISDHRLIIPSGKKDSTGNFKKASKVFKWFEHLYNTKCSSIFSYNYFSVLTDESFANQNNLSADEHGSKIY